MRATLESRVQSLFDMNHPSRLIDEAARARREGRIDDAYRSYADAAAICRANGDRRSLIHALKGLGQVECDRRNFGAALGAYEEGTALAREDSDSFLLAHTIRHLGDILRKLDRPKDAESCYTEALTLYRSNPNPPLLDLANAIRGMAILKDSMGESSESLLLWEEAHQIYASLGVQAGVVESKARQAQIARQNQH